MCLVEECFFHEEILYTPKLVVSIFTQFKTYTFVTYSLIDTHIFLLSTIEPST